jgi:hypothetical protein
MAASDHLSNDQFAQVPEAEPGMVRVEDMGLRRGPADIPGLSDHRGNIINQMANARTRPVRMQDLQASGQQALLYRNRLEHYRAGGEPEDHMLAMDTTAPVIYRDPGNGQHIMDGTHRVAAAISKGGDEIHAKVYDANRGRFL